MWGSWSEWRQWCLFRSAYGSDCSQTRIGRCGEERDFAERRGHRIWDPDQNRDSEPSLEGLLLPPSQPRGWPQGATDSVAGDTFGVCMAMWKMNDPALR